MSSSSNARVVPPPSERRAGLGEKVTGGKSRSVSGHGESKPERPDGRQLASPPLQSNGSRQGGVPGLQRSSRNLEERRTERLHVTTKETLISRTRSPERRSAPSSHPVEKAKLQDGSKFSVVESRPKTKPAESMQAPPHA